MNVAIGLLFSAAEVAGVSAAEATGSAVIGSVAESAVSGAISSQVTKLADNAISTVVDTIFGANAYENKKKQFYESIDEAKAIGLFSGDIGNEREVLQHIRESNYTHNELINKIHNFAHDFSDEVTKKRIDMTIPLNENSSVGSILAQLSQQNSVYYYLVNKLLDTTGNLVIPTDESFQKVAAVYNGKDNNFSGQIAKTSFDGTNTIWTEYDETGQEYSWIFPLMNNYSSINALWGTYCGLKSPNNGPPLRSIINGRVVESYLDKISFFHDLDYGRYGNFSLLADQKMISRASQNKDKFVFEGEELMASVSINYFSVLGGVMRKIMSNQEPDPIIKSLFKDVYNTEVSNDELNTFINHNASYGDTNSNLVNLINNLEIEID